jgi:CHAT domain-containing protein
VARSRRLGPGERIEQRTGGDDVFDHEITLGKGQVISVDLRSEDTDLSVVLFSPAGMPILFLESTSGLPGGPLKAVAATAGSYRLRVQAHHPGSFSLRLAPFREATGVDGNGAAAALLVSQANLICRRNEGAGRNACSGALPSYQAALAKWRPDLDRQEIALTHYWLGHAWQSLYSPERARDAYGEARRWFLAAGDHAAAAVAGESFAETFYYANEYTLAQGAFRRACDDFRHVHNHAGEAAALNNLALVERTLGKFQDALEDYEKALAAMVKLGRRRDQAVLLSSIGALYLDLEKPQKALDRLQQALAIQRAEPGKPEDMIVPLINIGMARSRLGSTSEALQSLGAALELAKKYRLKHNELLARVNRAYVHLKAKHNKEAADDLEAALPLARELRSRKEEGAALAYLTELSFLQGDYGKAFQHSQDALRLFQAIGDRRAESKALFGAALVQYQLGRVPDALASIKKSIALGEFLRSKVLNEELRTSLFGSVRPRFELAVELLMESDSRNPSQDFKAQAFEASERARARSVLDELAEAHADIRAGVAPDLLAKERSILEQIQKHETERQSLSAVDADPEGQRKIVALETEVESLLTLRDEVLAQIKAKSPRYAALVQPQPRKLTEIQRDLLDRDSLLLSYFLGDKRSFLWAIDRQGLRSVELPGRSRIEDAARTLWEKIGRSRNRSARAQRDVDGAMMRLGEMLLPPSLGRLEARRLLIIPDGALQFVPFTALPEPGIEPGSRVLAESHEIVELPSASALSLLRQSGEARRAAPMTLAAFADPVFGVDDIRVRRPPAAAQGPLPEPDRLSRLGSSRQEVEHILAYVPQGKSFAAFGFDANLEKVKSMDLSRFRMLHFATHGTLGSRPELSGIFLSRLDMQGHTRDNFLSALDVYNLDLAADLVVLSACETALGDDLRSEGVGRLTRAFLYAGAKSVVVSLWSVSDEATAELMNIFYSGILQKRLPPAAALREAQLAIRREKRWSSPYYWAGFVLQGDWK